MSRTIEDDFNDALDRIERDARAGGMTLTSLCRKAGVSRATPDRWRKSPPATIQIMANMQRIAEKAKNTYRFLDRKDWAQQLAKRGVETEAEKK